MEPDVMVDTKFDNMDTFISSSEDDDDENSMNYDIKFDGMPLKKRNIYDLPLLLLEYILSHLTYHEVLQFRLLSKYWDSIVKNYLSRADRNFLTNLSNYRVQWVAVKEQVEDCHQSPELSSNKSKKLRTIPRMSPRFYHLACYVDNFMYVYGGCVDLTTAYNDLWRFDIIKKKWLRIIAEGTLPLPRFFPSFTLYNCKDDFTGEVKQYIVLFGGILFPIGTSTTLENKILNTIHLFDISNNRWTLINIKGNIELKAGYHSASIIGDEMIVCNGIRLANNNFVENNNKVYVFDLKKHCWRLQRTVGISEFYSTQSQAEFLQSCIHKLKITPNSFVIDRHHILYIDNTTQIRPTSAIVLKRIPCHEKSCQQCSQLLAEQPDKCWQWSLVEVTGLEVESRCGDICQVGNLLVYLSVKNGYYFEDNSRFPPTISLPYVMDKRFIQERRLETLDFYKKYYDNRMSKENNNIHHKMKQKITLQLNLLDTSKIISESRIFKIRKFHQIDYAMTPNAFNYYSLVATPHSLILFGSYYSNCNVANKLFLLVSKPEINLN